MTTAAIVNSDQPAICPSTQKPTARAISTQASGRIADVIFRRRVRMRAPMTAAMSRQPASRSVCGGDA